MQPKNKDLRWKVNYFLYDIFANILVLINSLDPCQGKGFAWVWQSLCRPLPLLILPMTPGGFEMPDNPNVYVLLEK